ncbi:hypothetical protein [Streptomyces sp. NPDC006691]|uniref:hypothetical protein n=1 Tax=Streptomyces sp. NPDC006691 TaxID=3364757 RepID=UPI0036A83FC5
MNAKLGRGDGTLSTQPWKSVSTSLVVTRTALDPQAISDALELPRAGTVDECGAGVVSREGWWAFVHPAADHPRWEHQLRSLAGHVQPRAAKVRELISLGHSLHISISGTAGTGDTLFISLAAQQHLAALALPVRCTVISTNGEPPSDPLNWLD